MTARESPRWGHGRIYAEQLDDLPAYVLRLVPELSETEAHQLAAAYQARSA